ncbi:CD59 glycoprotein-like [Pleurodeles waltl]|uniref:CD59 glycoprotein-like n=1 Tax=Pleurodeles waltl TaxID=8319 RepID=UPI003709841E
MKITTLLLFLAVVVCTGEAIICYSGGLDAVRTIQCPSPMNACFFEFVDFIEFMKCMTMEECEQLRSLSPDVTCCQTDLCNESPFS